MVLMTLLVASFAIQGWLVYSDPAPTESLGTAALRGRRVWHANNCQACHQLYGFGGFLGPDLTNAVERLGQERLATVLTVGAGRMPAFGLSPAEIEDVEAFLRAMNESGRGQARRPLGADEVADPVDVRRRAVEARLAVTGEAAAAAGHAVVTQRACRACHAFPGSGPRVAPSLVGAASRLSPDELARVLSEGRPTRGMPPPGLSAAEREDVAAFLSWLDRESEAVARAQEALTPEPRLALGELPWWEFP